MFSVLYPVKFPNWKHVMVWFCPLFLLFKLLVLSVLFLKYVWTLSPPFCSHCCYKVFPVSNLGLLHLYCCLAFLKYEYDYNTFQVLPLFTIILMSILDLTPMHCSCPSLMNLLGFLKSNIFFFFFFFFLPFYGCTCAMWKFPGEGSNQSNRPIPQP